jgi:hypothetical protein
MEHEISKTRSKKNHPLKYHKETTKKQKKEYIKKIKPYTFSALIYSINKICVDVTIL